MTKYANLRDKRAFPRVLDLPDAEVFDPEHYKLVSEQVVEPRKHWCLIAEIAKVEDGLPLQLMAVDLTQKPPFWVVFETQDLGASFAKAHPKLGDTVAIMYPRKRIRRGLIEVIQSDYYSIKLFRMPLQTWCGLNDLVPGWPKGFAKHTHCHNCDQATDLRLLCQRCDIVSYCCETCKLNDQVKGHGIYCKVIRDKSFQDMWTLNWQQFRNFLTFPCNASTFDVSEKPKGKPGKYQVRSWVADFSVEKSRINPVWCRRIHRMDASCQTSDL